MRKELAVAFLLMGFSFSATQVLVARELLTCFTGNELSIGIVLGSWLLLEALGSGLLGHLGRRLKTDATAYAWLQVSLSLLLPLSLYAVVTVRRLIGTTAGQGIGLASIVWSSLLVLSPLGLVDGAMFTLGCHVYSKLTKEKRRAGGTVYVLEAVGGIVGGMAFTYLFIPYLESAQVALVVASLNLASAAWILLRVDRTKGGGRTWIDLGVVVLLLLTYASMLFPANADRVQRWLTGQQWSPYNAVDSQDSLYGNVTVVKGGQQVTFFSNGVPLITAPNPNVMEVEELAHLPLLLRDVPSRVLVIGGGVGGLLSELLKYPIERLDYAEPDPALIEMVRKHATSLTEGELDDPRVTIHPTDGRLLVQQMRQGGLGGYDLLVTSLPYPSTLQLNRLYTEQFFSDVRDTLGDDGILVVTLPGSDSYVSPGMRRLNWSVYEALRCVFPYVHVIPGDVNLWLASPGLDLGGVPVSSLVGRWEEREIPALLVSADHIRYKFRADRLEWFWEALLAGGPVQANRDLRPSGLLHSLSYWSELFSPRLSKYFSLLGRLSFIHVVGPVAVLCLVIAVIRTLGSREVTVPFAVAATGFAGMSYDLIVVFAFQILYGTVYRQMALLITAFMAGLSLGGWSIARWLRGRDGRGECGRALQCTLVRLEAGVVLYLAGLPIALTLMNSLALGRVSTVVPIALLALNAGAGALVGMQFPLANALYSPPGSREGSTAGTLYAADLTGACLGAALVSTALLPALGMIQTCLSLVVLKVGSLALVMSRKRGEERAHS
ncbi:MAG: fused MFS/spermidine synthase [Anaerolineae bacterium]